MKTLLAVSAIVGLLAPLPIRAATYTVTSTADDGTPGTLRYAISEAISGSDIINFNLIYPATITLTSGTQLVINAGLTINGPGAFNVAINGAPGGQRILSVVGGAVVTISGLTIENGSSIDGGGIFNNSTLTVTNCILSGNGVSALGPIVQVGGGIYNVGTLTMTNSTVSGNSGLQGGGIYNGGEGTMTVTNSTISGNSFVLGGGIFNSGVLTVTNSTISGNSVLALSNDTAVGGGIYNVAGTLTVKNTLVAASLGGNCHESGGTIISLGHNLSDDSSCTGFLTGTGDENGIPAGLDPAGLLNHGGPTPTIALLPASPAVNAIPVTQTNYCTLADGITPVGTDQRGVSRPQGSACDIGAFELAEFASFQPFAILDISSHGFAAGGTFSVSATGPAITPLTQIVHLQVGTFSTTLPAGSFKSNGFGGFEFNGTVNGSYLVMTMQPLIGKEYTFGAVGLEASLTGTTNPVTMHLEIGESAGTAAITAAIIP